MQINSSVSDKNTLDQNVSFLFTVDFLLVLSCSTFSNDISWIDFPELNWSQLRPRLQENGVMGGITLTRHMTISMLLIGWGQKFHQHHDRINHIVF